jgi:NAD(P)-dependent dehydrogenase (short-subunit alcohol dehydrogenase family)
VLVTGCASGIGLALARRLRDWRGAHAVITARASSLDRLRAAGFEEGERLWLRPLDVTRNSERKRVVSEIDEHLGGVDILINNAGLTFRSVHEHLHTDEIEEQMSINFVGPMDLARLVLPSMRRKRYGHIVNVSSVGGMMAMPTMGLYSASKFALEGASEALWYELRPWNVSVTLVQPGFIHSESFRNVRLSRDAQAMRSVEDEPYRAVYESMSPFIEGLMNRAFATPDTVARRILRTLERSNPPLRVSATIDARVFYMLRRLLPRRLYHAVLFRCLPDVRRWGPGD